MNGSDTYALAQACPQRCRWAGYRPCIGSTTPRSTLDLLLRPILVDLPLPRRGF